MSCKVAPEYGRRLSRRALFTLRFTVFLSVFNGFNHVPRKL